MEGLAGVGHGVVDQGTMPNSFSSVMMSGTLLLRDHRTFSLKVRLRMPTLAFLTLSCCCTRSFTSFLAT